VLSARRRSDRPRAASPSTIKENPVTSTKRLIALLLLALFSMGTLGACNTIEGVGEDIEAAGDSIEDAAEDCDDGDC
jgi:predicted small secreted protein